MFKKLIASVALAAAVTTPVLAESPKEINFGIIATESSQVLKQNWQPLLDDMSKQTGMKVNAFFAPDYAGVIEGMRFNKVQVAWFGNKSAMEAVDRARGEIFAKVVAMDGSPGYWSLVIAHKDITVQDAGRPGQARQGHQLRHRRPELDLRLPGAQLLRLRARTTSTRRRTSRPCATPTTKPT